MLKYNQAVLGNRLSKLKTYSPKIKNLPVLNSLIVFAKSKKIIPTSLDRVSVIVVQHTLWSSINLLDKIIELGIIPKNIFVIGKHYSECLQVVECISSMGIYYQKSSQQKSLGNFNQIFTKDIKKLWDYFSLTVSEHVKDLVILDHGGVASKCIPNHIIDKFNIVGIEKTTSGLLKYEKEGLPQFPIISMAKCAIKKNVESELIVGTILNKLTTASITIQKNQAYGIVGFGSIGKHLASRLISKGLKVIIYDSSHFELKNIQFLEKVTIANSLANLVDLSTVIFGCTGDDIFLSSTFLDEIQKDKICVSCSSGDIEFLSLLKKIENQELASGSYNDLYYITKNGATFRILNGGFPINFDHSGESVPSNKIQLTRSLVMAGLLQSFRILQKKYLLKKTAVYALDVEMQSFIVNEWLKYQSKLSFPKEIINQFKNTEWIEKNSEGRVEPSINDSYQTKVTNKDAKKVYTTV